VKAIEDTTRERIKMIRKRETKALIDATALRAIDGGRIVDGSEDSVELSVYYIRLAADLGFSHRLLAPQASILDREFDEIEDEFAGIIECVSRQAEEYLSQAYEAV
jgi:hypothetical protein